jgi:hypothetical protein
MATSIDSSVHTENTHQLQPENHHSPKTNQNLISSITTSASLPSSNNLSLTKLNPQQIRVQQPVPSVGNSQPMQSVSINPPQISSKKLLILHQHCRQNQ